MEVYPGKLGPLEPLPIAGAFESGSGAKLEGVVVSRYLRIATADDLGWFHVVLGYSVVDSRWRFEKEGYVSREFLVPEAAAETGSMSFEPNVTLEPEDP